MVRYLTLLFFFISTSFSYAGDLSINLATNMAQQEFADFTEQLGTAIAYRAVAPAEPLGILGFDAGVEASTVAIDADQSFWTKAVPDPPDAIIIPRVHIQKGLPFGIDVGLSYTNLPQSDISVIGAEIKYAILGGNIALPAIAVRGTYSQLMGVDQLDLSTFGADLSVSKGIAMLTPYIGGGITRIAASSNSSTPIIKLEDEDTSIAHGFAGLKVSFLIINMVAEIDVAQVNTYSLRLNIGL